MRYALILVFPLLLWIAINPLAGVVVLTAIVGSVIVARKGSRLVHRFVDNDEFSFDLGRNVRITITHSSDGEQAF